MWTRRFLACITLALAMMPSYAFDRPFPANTKRGTMTPAVYPEIVIDGKSRTLSAGARIWNEENLIEQPASLRGNGLSVNYTENEAGEIDRVWILTREEAQRAPQNK